MPIFKEENGILRKLNTFPLGKEKNLQIFIEQNLMEVLEVHFLSTEYPTTNGGRIDTLGIDKNGAPVIIEYKLSKDINVINQSLYYLRWLKAQKVEFFEMLVFKKLGESASKSIDWKNPRVICIAEKYNKFDIGTAEMVNVRLELLKYQYYENGILSLESHLTELSEEKVQPIKDVRFTEENQGIEGRTLSDHFKNAEPFIKTLFDDLKEKILQIDDIIIEKITKPYIAFRAIKNFAEVHIQKSRITVHIRAVDYDDPLGKVEKSPETNNWTLSKKIFLQDTTDLDYVMKIIEQSYKDVL